MRSGTVQLQLENDEVATGGWWSAGGREATALLRRHLPELILTARQLADLIDGEAVLLVVRVGARAIGEIVPEAEVKVQAAHLALSVVPRGRGIRRRTLSGGRVVKVEAA